jgi:hypothetical protein
MYLSRDYIEYDLAPRMGWGDPAAESVACPSLPEDWRVVMDNDFDVNQYGWQLGGDSDEYADSELKMEDGLLYYDVHAMQSVFSLEKPVSKKVRDFYLSTSVRKLEGPDDLEYGVTFRHIEDRVYFFSIQDSGLVKVRFRDLNSNWQGTMLSSYSPKVHAGQRNQLVVFSEDDAYHICVNGFEQGKFYIDDYQSGEIGIALELENAGDYAELEYDDLIVYAP